MLKVIHFVSLCVRPCLSACPTKEGNNEMAERFRALLTIRHVCSDFFSAFICYYRDEQRTAKIPKRNNKKKYNFFSSSRVHVHGSPFVLAIMFYSLVYGIPLEKAPDKGFTKYFMFIANQFYALQILLFNPQVKCATEIQK